MTRPRTIAIAASVAAIALLTPAAALAASATFFFAGSVAQQFSVPTGVDKLTIVAIGAQGGAGSSGSTAPPPNGAQVISTIKPVTPGDTYTVLVGGDGFLSAVGGPDGGGFNGGGGTNEQTGWGGGGASAVCAPGVSPCTNSNALVVAAGGGGVSAFNDGGAGGLVGGDGSPQSGDASFARGGLGATQSAGGAGGAAGTGVDATAGSPGSAGQGGNGASGPCGGGGGGGGLFGGGGGGTSSNGCGGGGGGSSAGPAGSTFTSGVAPGNLFGGGQITIFSEADTTSSSPSSASLTLGGSLTDGAQVSTDGGDGPPTGSVSFFACGPLTSAAGCASGGTEFDTGEPLNGTDNSPSVTSESFTPTAAGTWCFRAEYSGDGNYPPSTDGSSDECFTVSKADTQTVSQPSPASITLGASGADSVTDGATVSGNAAGGSPTGTVSFFVCGPLAGASGCASTATPVGGAVSVGPGGGNTSSATSASFTPTRAGTWCFLAVYSGDGNYNGSRDRTGDECFTVAKADTLTASTPQDGTIALGQTSSDGATVSGNADGGSPTGTVSFFLCGPLASALGCTSTADQIGSAVSVTAGAGDTATATSASFTPSAVGTWCVLAVYSGDGNYKTSQDSSAAECLTVTTADSQTVSQPSPASITLGASGADSVTDMATVSGNATGGSPTGTVSFFVCGPLASASGCSSTATQVGAAVSVSIGASDTSSAGSASFTPMQAGTWCFLAVYSGDGNYNGSRDGSGDECFTVAQADTSTASAPHDATIVLGQSSADGATVSGNADGGSPTGTVSFFLCGPLTSASGCTSMADQIGSAVSLSSASASTATATSASFTPSAVGTWCVLAVYSGDSNYTTSQDSSAAECLTVTAADSQTVSQPSPASITLGAGGADSVTDMATVSGNATGGSPTGTVSFFVCGPLAGASGCASTATPVGGAVSVGPASGDTSTATSASFTPMQVGTWCFLAVYSGDGSYNGSRDGSGDECFTVAQADTSTASAPHDATIVLGQSSADGATVSGNADGGSPTGTVSFFLCGPLASALGCTSSADQIGSAVSVTAGAGDTATATSASFTPSAVGTWCVLALYSGDANYKTSQDSSAAECLTVSKAPPGLSSSPQSATTTLSGSDRDLVTVSGNAVGGGPTGSVTFSVCGPLSSATGCASGGKQVGGAVTLAKGSGNSATATSASFTPTAPGTWCFRATYPGDANYSGASDGSARECLTVPTPAQPSVTIVSPKSGAVYTVGQTVRASYSCADPAAAPGLASCTGPVASGAVVSTSKPGRHTFTVLATSKDGEQGTRTVQYRVIRPSNHHSVGELQAHRNGHVTFRVRVPGPGVVDVLVTNWKDNLARVAKLLGPAKGRFVWGRARVVARRKSTLTVDVAPNKQALLVLAHPRYKVRLRVWVSFTPRHGRQRNLGFYGVPLTG